MAGHPRRPKHGRSGNERVPLTPAPLDGVSQLLGDQRFVTVSVTVRVVFPLPFVVFVKVTVSV